MADTQLCQRKAMRELCWSIIVHELVGKLKHTQGHGARIVTRSNLHTML
uniref:Uncharacterized protein n=1 Tax=Anguilla anguilla TaxID=7936 RepID=A0A0E9PYM6_ANGAN